MEGPDDKFYQFIKINRFESDFILPERTEILKFLSGKKLSEVINAEFEGTVQALKNIGRPVLTITLNRVSPETLGALFMYYMIATVVTGKLMNVNPFGQPGVESGKKIATKMLMGSTTPP
jgi:glucose-6-phosphate isomerase